MSAPTLRTRLEQLAAMQANELMELSAAISVHGPAFVRGEGRLSRSGLETYWSASRKRLDQWYQAINADRVIAGDGWLWPKKAADQRQRKLRWQKLAPVLEEIFAAEVLTRIWTAIACESDRRSGGSYVTPLVRSILIGQLDTRNRALHLLVRWQASDLVEVAALNNMRRRTERWTDLLLACLLPDCNVEDVAHDQQRTNEFAFDFHGYRNRQQDKSRWRLLLSSLQTAFRFSMTHPSPNQDLNREIASSILSCFRPELFDSIEPIGSLWMDRLLHVADDTQDLLDELLAIDGVK